MKTLLLFAALLLPAMAGTESAGKTEGSASAPLTIELYSDFQCPGCKGFHERTLSTLIKDYVVTGKAKLVYREFPMPAHQYARTAALYATAAARIGKYADVCNSLFAKQTQWAATGKVDEAACAALAPDVAKKLRALVKDPAVAADVQRDMDRGVAGGVNGTPMLAVTHKARRYAPVSANTNYNLLRQLLDGILKN
jgi:protein-disulfide isomerase